MATALITGCSSGFGLLAALSSRAGHRVVATMRDPARGELARAAGDEVCRSDPAARRLRRRAGDRAVARAKADHGPLDVLVNNAGIELRSSIEDASEADIRRQFETNVFGAVRVIQAVLPAMRARRAGTIVNVSSIAGLVSRPYGGFYAASKHALEAISEALHYELRRSASASCSSSPAVRDAVARQRLRRAVHARVAVLGALRAVRYPHQVPGAGRRGRRPERVARLICDAALAETPSLRHLAGDDARTIATAYRQMEFEAFEQAMRQTLDWWD